MTLAALARTAAPVPQPLSPDQRVGMVPLEASAAPATPATGRGMSRADGFDTLSKYIPTETVTIFVAICSGRSAIEIIAGNFSYPAAYAACAVLTPALMWLIAMGRTAAPAQRAQSAFTGGRPSRQP